MFHLSLRTKPLLGRRRSSRGGMTMVEIIISVMILTVLLMSLAAAILGGVKVEMLARESALVQQEMAAQLESLYNQPAATIEAADGQEFDLASEAAESLRPVEPRDHIAWLDVREVDPSDPTQDAADSGFYEVIATGRWVGMAGISQTKITAYVSSTDE